MKTIRRRLHRMLTKSPSLADIAALEIVREETHHYSNRKRGSVTAIAKDPDTLNTTVLERVAEARRRSNNWDVIVVFVWSAREYIDRLPYDVVRFACADDDGGWTGDGYWLGGAKVKPEERFHVDWRLGWERW